MDFGYNDENWDRRTDGGCEERTRYVRLLPTIDDSRIVQHRLRWSCEAKTPPTNTRRCLTNDDTQRARRFGVGLMRYGDVGWLFRENIAERRS